jgi:hypothetical protein
MASLPLDRWRLKPAEVRVGMGPSGLHRHNKVARGALSLHGRHLSLPGLDHGGSSAGSVRDQGVSLR